MINIAITQIRGKGAPEFVTIANITDTPVDLTNWKLVGCNGIPGDNDVPADSSKWIDFNICGGWYGTCSHPASCILNSGESITIYEGSSQLGGDALATSYELDSSEQHNSCYINPLIRGFNDPSQPSNTINSCDENPIDCSHINGDGDRLALFESPSDINYVPSGKWDCNVTNAHTYVNFYDNENGWDNINSSKYFDIINPDVLLLQNSPNNSIPSNWQVLNVGGDNYMNIPGDTLGDVNQDGIVNVVDITLVVQSILGTMPTQAQQYLSDVNQDGFVNIADIVLMVNSIMNVPASSQSRIMRRIITMLKSKGLNKKKNVNDHTMKVDGKLKSFKINTYTGKTREI